MRLSGGREDTRLRVCKSGGREQHHRLCYHGSPVHANVCRRRASTDRKDSSRREAERGHWEWLGRCSADRLQMRLEQRVVQSLGIELDNESVWTRD